jgi:hypothetical protein
VATNEALRGRRTDLSEVKQNRAAGIAFIVAGSICVLVGIPTIVMLFGLLVIFSGFFLIALGVHNLNGTQEGPCPYCTHSVTVGAKAKTFKCPHCKKVSTKKDGCLESIE